jgi:hypothetical protein
MARFVSRATGGLYSLATTLVAHEALGLKALSGRAFGKGGRFAGCGQSKDCNVRTVDAVAQELHRIWPADLE